jgi:two-component system nitrate/nitrite response regulator NarL
MKKITLLIVDDHPMVLEGMKTLLSHIPSLEIMGTAANAFEAITFLKSNLVDVAVVDISLPDISGIELTTQIKKEFPEVKVLAMSTFKEQSYVTEMIKHGALGYLVKSASREEIEEAIRHVSQGELFLGSGVSTLNLQGEPNRDIPLISRREKEVLQLIVDGLTNPQIAEKLFISLHTVDSHRKNLLTKFEVNNTASLIRIAVKAKIVVV